MPGLANRMPANRRRDEMSLTESAKNGTALLRTDYIRAHLEQASRLRWRRPDRDLLYPRNNEGTVRNGDDAHDVQHRLAFQPSENLTDHFPHS